MQRSGTFLASYRTAGRKLAYLARTVSSSESKHYGHTHERIGRNGFEENHPPWMGSCLGIRDFLDKGPPWFRFKDLRLVGKDVRHEDASKEVGGVDDDEVEKRSSKRDLY